MELFTTKTLPQVSTPINGTAVLSISDNGTLSIQAYAAELLAVKVGSKVAFAIEDGQLYVIVGHPDGFGMRASGSKKTVLMRHRELAAKILGMAPKDVRNIKARTYRMMISKEKESKSLGTETYNAWPVITSSATAVKPRATK